MSNSVHAPLRGNNGPYVMHLEQVVRMMDRGADFLVELHPLSDVAEGVRGPLMRRMRIRITDGGGVQFQPMDGGSHVWPGMRLSDYKARWRCWAGDPGPRRMGTRWSGAGC